MERMMGEIKAHMAQMNAEMAQMMRAEKFATVMGDNEAEITALKDKVCECETKITALNGELREERENKDNRIHALEVQVRELTVFSDTVKIRVALTLVRKAVAEAVERAKGDTETWATFISGISMEEWNQVGISRSQVKDLLAHRAYDLNTSICEISAKDVIGSIAMVPLGSSGTS